MPLQKLQFKPGINRENTNYAGEGGWFDSEKIRFRSGYPEKIGGWQSISNTTVYTFKGVCRTLWNWITLSGTNLLALGTDQKVYVENGGAYRDITPIRNTTTINTDPFATTSGSKLVVVTDTAHSATVGTYVTFSGATAVGGLTLNGEFEIIRIVDGNNYNIASVTAASSTATGGGASVSAAYQLNAGNAVYTVNNGWSAGPYSRETWGSEFGEATAINTNQQLRLWSLDNYGQNLVLAPRQGTPYYWEVDTTTSPARAVTLESEATTAGFDGTFVPHTVYEMHTSGIQRFAIAIGANPYDPLDADTEFDPMLVRWSDQENLFQWIPAADNQSGEQRMSHGSRLVTARHGRQEFVIWSDSAVFAMQYLGPPYVWGFNLLMDGTSIMSPGAVTGASNIHFWMGLDKFYMYDGRVQTLPCTVRQYVFNNLNKDQAFQVVAGGNEGFSEVWWHYPSLNSTVNDSYVIFNYIDNAWYYGTLNRSAWIDSSLREYPMAAFSVQNSYLGSAVTSTDTTLNLIDASSYPYAGTVVIESEEITYSGTTATDLLNCTRGVNNTTATSHTAYTAVTNKVANQVMFHELGVDDASTPQAQAIESYVSSSDFDIGDGHNFGFIWRMLPDVSFDGSVVNQPEVTFSVYPRQNAGSAYGTADDPAVTSAQNYTNVRAYTVQQFTGQVYTRIRGRQISFRVGSTDLGVSWQLGVPRVDIRPDGRR